MAAGGAFLLALAGPVQVAQAQTQRDIDALISLGRRLAATERASMDPVLVAVETNDAQSLLMLFRSTSDPALRDRAGAALIQMGGSAPGRLIATIHPDFKTKLRKYRGAFQTEVAALAKKQRGGVSDTEIAKIQADFSLLHKDPGLTRDRITKEGDPAIARLEELLAMDRKTVFANAPHLVAARNELLGMSAMAAQAARQLTKSDRKLADRLPPTSLLDTELAETEELAVLMVTPMTPEAQDVMFDNMTVAKELDPEEASAILMLNLRRIRVGIQPLAIDLKLGDSGRDHSKDMRTLGFFAHESPVSGKRTPWDRARLFGTSASGENIFMGRSDHRSAIMAWWYSPGHFKNMMNPGFRRIGLGRVESHWTQLFGS